jgi:hypothetical protein
MLEPGLAQAELTKQYPTSAMTVGVAEVGAR